MLISNSLQGSKITRRGVIGNVILDNAVLQRDVKADFNISKDGKALVGSVNPAGRYMIADEIGFLRAKPGTAETVGSDVVLTPCDGCFLIEVVGGAVFINPDNPIGMDAEGRIYDDIPSDQIIWHDFDYFESYLRGLVEGHYHQDDKTTDLYYDNVMLGIYQYSTPDSRVDARTGGGIFGMVKQQLYTDLALNQIDFEVKEDDTEDNEDGFGEMGEDGTLEGEFVGDVEVENSEYESSEDEDNDL